MFNKNILNLQNGFISNITKVITGTFISQLIVLFITPILTRLYKPEAFGVLALYVSIFSVTSIFANGKYDKAVIIANSDHEAHLLVRIGFIVTTVISLLYFFIIFFFQGILLDIVKEPALKRWFFLIPVSFFFFGVSENLSSLANRKKEYQILVKSRIAKSTGASFAKLLLFWTALGMSGALLLGELFGLVVIAFLLLFYMLKYHRQPQTDYFNSHEDLINCGKRYKSFPLYNIPSSFLTLGAIQIPVLLFASIFGPTIVGLYAVTKSLLDSPIHLISSAVREVFYQKAAEEFREKGNCKELYVSTMKGLFFLSIIPFTILFFISPLLFFKFLGEEWASAGQFAQLLIPMYFFKFIASPLSYLFYVADRQKELLFWQLGIAFLAFFSIKFGHYYFNDVLYCIGFYTVSYSIFYILICFRSYRFSTGLS